MKDTDQQRLSRPYQQGQAPPEHGLEQALGVHAPRVWELHQAIQQNLMGGQGTEWWKPLDIERSCLIAEHLAQTTWSVTYNLLEAGIHILELDEWQGRESVSMARAVTVRNGRVSIGTPAPQSAADEIVHPMVDLHTAGFLRAVGSALDCLGGTIVGVLGLPTNLLKSDFNLPRDPGWSEAQAWRDPSRSACLTERAQATLQGVKASAVQLADETALDLLQAWNRRRNDPELIPQPAEQWMDAGMPSPGQFEGFAPGSEPFNPSLYASSPDAIRRLHSAGVLNRPPQG